MFLQDKIGRSKSFKFKCILGEKGRQVLLIDFLLLTLKNISLYVATIAMKNCYGSDYLNYSARKVTTDN